jgi:hypothetical protein
MEVLIILDELLQAGNVEHPMKSSFLGSINKVHIFM